MTQEGPSQKTEVLKAQLAGAGDREAQRWVVAHVLGRVRKVSRALARNATDADDASQISLLEVIKSAKTYRGDSTLEAWAGRIAVRTTLRFLRNERKAREPQEEEELVVHVESKTAEGLPQHVRAYLSRLSENQRQAIVLHHALEHSVEEIAEMTNANFETVRSRLRLGMAELRRCIRQDLTVKQALATPPGDEVPRSGKSAKSSGSGAPGLGGAKER